ncbi:MAG: TonB-dependent receptor [Caulobacteraceae bacterium]
MSHDTALDIDLNDTYSINSQLTFHFGGFDMRYIAGYTTYSYDLHSDWDNTSITSYRIPLAPGVTLCNTTPGCTALTVFPSENFRYIENNRWQAHELTFLSTDDGPLQWVFGIFYFDERYDQPTTISAVPSQTQVYAPRYPNFVTVDGTAAPLNPSGAMYSAEYDMQTKSEAVFGQIDWSITDAWKMTVGLRYTRDTKKGDEFYRLILFNDNFATSPFGGATGVGSLMPAVDITPFVASTGAAPGVVVAGHALPDGRYARSLEATFSSVTGTFGVDWTPDADTLLYGRYSRGYKSGGFNAGTLAALPLTNPEHVDAFELGLKRSWGANLLINAALFYYDYQDAQIPVGVNISGTIQTQFFNIPKAKSEGFELAAIWSPIENLQLNLTYSLNRTAIQSDCVLVAGVATGACLVDSNDPLGTAAGSQPIGPQIATATGLQQPQSVRGAALPQAPRNKWAFNINYTWEDVLGGSLTLSGNYIWKDLSYASVFNRAYNLAPRWDQVDLRAIWRSEDENLTVIGYVKNVFDTLGYEAAGTGIPLSTGTVSSYVLTQPRVFGIEVHVKFQ